MKLRVLTALAGFFLFSACSSDKDKKETVSAGPVQLEVDAFIEKFCKPAEGGAEDAVIVRTKSGERAMQCAPETTSVILNGDLKTANATCTKMACTKKNPCCNSCTANAVLAGRNHQIVLDGISCENQKGEDACAFLCGTHQMGASYLVSGELNMPAYDYMSIKAPQLALQGESKPKMDARCYQPPKGVGNCEGFHPAVYYNPQTDDCEKGGVSGCSAEVPFKKLSECRKTCGVPEPEAEPARRGREPSGIDMLDKVTPKEDNAAR